MEQATVGRHHLNDVKSKDQAFMFVPVFALVPWLGYQTFQKPSISPPRHNLRLYAFWHRSLQSELDAVLRPQSQPGLRFVPEPIYASLFLMDSSMNGRLLASHVVDDDRISLKLGQFDDQIAFALEVNDSTRFYQEPLFGRSEAAPFDAVRLHLSNRSSSSEILLATEGSGPFDVVISSTAPAAEKNRRIKAIGGNFRVATGLSG